MELINPLVEAYAKNYSSALDDVLVNIEKDTVDNHTHAHMMSGHVQGKFLQILSELLQPNKVLEIGTFTGFSAICLARRIAYN
jgi:caffeoyl-CoA O-methyltransferase